MRVSTILFSLAVFAVCASLAYGQASVSISEPTLGSPVLLGVDENQPAMMPLEIEDPVLGSVILIAATSDEDRYQIRTASSSTENVRTLVPMIGNPPQKINSRTQYQCELSIHGDGYFQVQTPDGQFLYAHKAVIQLDPEGRLMTAEGYLLAPAIKIPEDARSIEIHPDGVILMSTVEQPFAAASELKATISIVRFENRKGLSTTDRVYYSATKESGEPIKGTPRSNGFGVFHQGPDVTEKYNGFHNLIRWVITR